MGYSSVLSFETSLFNMERANHSPSAINWGKESEVTKVVMVRIHQEIIHYLHGLTCEDFNEEGKKIGIVDGCI